MLCSSCHRPIPLGQEIQMTGGWFPWWGGGSETVCKKCSIQKKKKNQKYWVIGFICFFLFMIFLPLIVHLILGINKK